ncbi:MAG: ComF family protein [Alphaproteobacteria bacterium]|nr:ComF family protein [Alphaproteobacteria bacterium]
MGAELITQIAATVGRFIFPQLCPICASEVTASGVCTACWPSLTLISGNACRQCGTPFPYQPLLDRCGNCLRQPPDFDAACCALVYGESSRQLVLGLKHSDRQDIAPVLAAMMLPNTLPMMMAADYLVPLPLHPRRFFSRRYNQSAELCRHLLRAAPELMPKYAPELLLRVKKTPPQGHKTRQQRISSMRGAFLVPPHLTPLVKDAHVLVIDDVLTTGASLSSAARALKRAGAKTVSVSTAARVC